MGSVPVILYLPESLLSRIYQLTVNDMTGVDQTNDKAEADDDIEPTVDQQ